MTNRLPALLPPVLVVDAPSLAHEWEEGEVPVGREACELAMEALRSQGLVLDPDEAIEGEQAWYAYARDRKLRLELVAYLLEEATEPGCPAWCFEFRERVGLLASLFRRTGDGGRLREVILQLAIDIQQSERVREVWALEDSEFLEKYGIRRA